MHYDERSTVCVSSQAGCAMGCGFCATGPGRVRPPAHDRRDRRAGGAGRRAAPGTTAGGSPTSCSWAWASRSRTTTPPGPRWSGSTRDLGLSARHLTVSTVGIVPGHPPPGHRGAAGEPGRVAPRRRRRPPRRAGADQPALPAEHADGRLRRVPAGEGPAAVVRVGAHRRGQRPRARRRAARRAVAEPAAPRPREPHPAQPHARLRRPRLAAAAGARVPRPAARAAA